MWYIFIFRVLKKVWYAIALYVRPQRVTPLQTNKEPGARFNMKTTSYQYRKSHCGDKTVLISSYLLNGISYTGKTII